MIIIKNLLTTPSPTFTIEKYLITVTKPSLHIFLCISIAFFYLVSKYKLTERYNITEKF